MSNRIPLDALPAPADEIRRDRWGRYLVVPPKGGEPMGYTRVTTVAKELDSSGGLAPWKATMTAIGLMMRPGLRAQWEALIAEHDGDPWYSGESGKSACKRLVEDCAAVGGANDRAEQGTSLHAITALVDSGRTLSHLTAETERDVDAYVSGLAAAGVSIVPEMIETTVVLDEYRVAGTFDRLVRAPGFDRALIADLKTGADLSYSWQSIAVQLAAYSRANAVYRQGRAVDGSEDVRVPMPAVDQSHGLVMWLNAGTGRLELHIVDLDQGWQAFEKSIWVREWRKAKVASALNGRGVSAIEPIEPITDFVPLLAESLARAQRIEEIETVRLPNATASIVVGIEVPQDPPPSRSVDDVRFLVELRDWLQARIDVIGSHSTARIDLAQSWPIGVPTLIASDAHAAEQLAEIERVLDAIEARHSVPFGANRPSAEPPVMPRLRALFPNSTISNGG